MKDNKGFTLIEVLAVLVILSIAIMAVFGLFRGTFSMADNDMNKINDNNIFEAAKLYVMENGNNFNDNGYVCVNISDLVSYGYLKMDSYENKIIKVSRNNTTMVINSVEYVTVCE